MKRTLVIALLALFALTATSAVAGIIVTETPQAAQFSATLEARALATPTLKTCKALPAVQKLEARYQGQFVVTADPPTEVDSPIASDPPTERYMLNFSLEALVEHAAGVGTAHGTWQLLDGRTVVGSGELLATVTTDPPGEVSPPDPDLQLRGLLMGLAQPPDPDMPAQRLLANLVGSLTDGALNFTGAVGEATPPDPESPAVLLPAIKC